MGCGASKQVCCGAKANREDSPLAKAKSKTKQASPPVVRTNKSAELRKKALKQKNETSKKIQSKTSKTNPLPRTSSTKIQVQSRNTSPGGLSCDTSCRQESILKASLSSNMDLKKSDTPRKIPSPPKSPKPALRRSPRVRSPTEIIQRFSACDVSTSNGDELKMAVSSSNVHERSSGTSVVDNTTLNVKASSVSKLGTSGLECRFGSSSPEKQTSSASVKVESDEPGVWRGPSSGEQSSDLSAKKGTEKREEQRSVSKASVALKDTDEQMDSYSVKAGSENRGAQTSTFIVEQIASPSSGHGSASAANVALSDMGEQANNSSVKTEVDKAEVQTTTSSEEDSLSPSGKEGVDMKEEGRSASTADVALDNNVDQNTISGVKAGSENSEAHRVASPAEQTTGPSVKLGGAKGKEQGNAFIVDLALNETEELSSTPCGEVRSDETEAQTSVSIEEQTANLSGKEGTDVREGQANVFICNVALNKTEDNPSTNGSFGKVQSGESKDQAKTKTVDVQLNDTEDQNSTISVKVGPPKHEEGTAASPVDVALSEPEEPMNIISVDVISDEAEELSAKRALSAVEQKEAGDSSGSTNSAAGRIDAKVGSYHPWNSDSGKKRPRSRVKSATPKPQQRRQKPNTKDVPTVKACDSQRDHVETEQGEGDVSKETTPPVSESMTPEVSTTGRSSRSSLGTEVRFGEKSGFESTNGLLDISKASTSNERCFSAKRSGDLPSRTTSQASIGAPSAQVQENCAGDTDQKRIPSKEESPTLQSSVDQGSTTSSKSGVIAPSCQSVKHEGSQAVSSACKASNVAASKRQSSSDQSRADVPKSASSRTSIVGSSNQERKRSASATSHRRSSVSQMSFVTDKDKRSCNTQSPRDARKTPSERSLAISPNKVGQRTESASSGRRSSVSQMSFVTDTDKRSYNAQSPVDARKTPSERTLTVSSYKAEQRAESVRSRRRSPVSQMSFVTDTDGNACSAQSPEDARKTPSEISLAISPYKTEERAESVTTRRRSPVSQMSFVTDTDGKACSAQSPGDARKTPSEISLAASPYKAEQRAESVTTRRRSPVSQMSFVTDTDGKACSAQSPGDARKTPSEISLAISPYKAEQRAESITTRRRSSVSQMSFVTDTNERSYNAQRPGDARKTPSERTLAVSPNKARERTESASSQKRSSVSQISFVTDTDKQSYKSQSPGDGRKTPSERSLTASPYEVEQRAESATSKNKNALQMSFAIDTNERPCNAQQRQGDVRSTSSDKTLRATSCKTRHRAVSATSQGNSAGFQQISNISAFSERPTSGDSQRGIPDRLTSSPHHSERHATSATSQRSSPISQKIVCETALNECTTNAYSPTDLCFGATPSPYQTEQSVTSQRSSPVYQEVSYAAGSSEYASCREPRDTGSNKETFSGLLERCARRVASIEVQKAILLNEDISCATASNERPPTAHGARATEVRSFTQLLEASERRVSVVNSLKASVADKDFFHTTESPKRPSSAQCSKDLNGNGSVKIGIAELLSQSEKRAASISALKTSVAGKDLSCLTASNEGHFSAQPVELGTSPTHCFASPDMRPRTAGSKGHSCNGGRLMSPSME